MKKEIRKLVFLLPLLGLVSTALLCAAVSPAATNQASTNGTATISAMFVMGDSSVDCGENTLFYSRLHRNLSLLPCSPSDHRSLVPHLLAEKMRVPVAVPFYSQNGSVSELIRGINFGSAQATIMNPNSQGYQSLNQQVRQASETVQLLNLGIPTQKALMHFIRSSLFFLSFGKDDFINNNKDNANDLPRMLAAEMERAVRSLHDLKIRRVVCAGILPLGCAPKTMMMTGMGLKSSCDWGGVNKRVLEYNVMMEAKVMELNARFPDLRVVFCDVFQGIREILANPRKYGIEEVKRACCGMGMYGAEIGCVSEEMACNNSKAHLWWDQYNPTKVVNSLLADSAWSGHPFTGLCRPITIQQLASSSVPRFGS